MATSDTTRPRLPRPGFLGAAALCAGGAALDFAASWGAIASAPWAVVGAAALCAGLFPLTFCVRDYLQERLAAEASLAGGAAGLAPAMAGAQVAGGGLAAAATAPVGAYGQTGSQVAGGASAAGATPASTSPASASAALASTSPVTSAPAGLPGQAGTQPAPQTVASPPDTAPLLDMEALAQELRGPEPVARLRAFVTDVRCAEAAADGLFEDRSLLAPSVLHSFLAEQLEDAGLLTLPADLPVHARIKDRSGLLRLEVIGGPGLNAGQERALLLTEAALNRCLLASRRLAPQAAPSRDGLYALCAELEGSLAAQGARIVVRAPNGQAHVTGEWDIRHALGAAIEALPSPYRVEADFRVNEQAGLAALTVHAFEGRSMAPRGWNGDRVSLFSPAEKDALASQLTCGAVLSLARFCAGLTPAFREVWATAIDSDGRCLLSARWSTGDLLKLGPRDTAAATDLAVRLGARAVLRDGALQPVRPEFCAEDERLCPEWRGQLPEVARTVLSPDARSALGCAQVRDLAASPDRAVAAFAERASQALGTTALESVQAVQALARRAHAALDDERLDRGVAQVLGALVEGTLPCNDSAAVREALLTTTELDRAVRDAIAPMEAGDAHRVIDILQQPVAEATLTCHETGQVVWRSFHSSVERAVYNRVFSDGREVRLAPGTLHAGLLALSTAWIQLGNPARSLACALKALDLDPCDTGALLRASRCHEDLGELAEAEEDLRTLLELCWEPPVIAVAYLRLGQVLSLCGEDARAVACFRRASLCASPVADVARASAARTAEQAGLPEPAGTFDDNERELQRLGIPVAPTDPISDVLLQGLKATVDEGAFVPAREFGAAVVALSGDEAVARAVASLV